MGEDLWIKANRLERDGRFEEALKLYLEEYERSRDLLIQAISLLSAARCAIKMERMEYAMELFEEAGRRYEEYAESSKDTAPNLAKWAYGIASRCYQLAGDLKSALNMLRRMEE